MTFSIFLHFYQPAEQLEDILEMVVIQSYLPLLKGIKNSDRAKITLNVTGSLLELLDKYKHYEVLDLLKELGNQKKLEFTGSAKYHAFLPLIPEKEVIRQIEMNNEVSKYFLGDSYAPLGFFPPEMGYSKNLCKIVEDMGFKWMILDEITALNTSYVPGEANAIYKIKDSNLAVFLRDRRVSNLIMSAVTRTQDSLQDALRKDLEEDKYLIPGMDGETFGHHRPGLEKFLFEMFEMPFLNFELLSNLPTHFKKTVELDLIESTWASSKDDIENKTQFLSWKDPTNPMHKLQWEFLNYVIDEVYKLDKTLPYYDTVRKKLDIALGSDHFWWASAKPWWSAEMIEYGAYALLDTLFSIKDISQEKIEKGRKYYENIVSTAFNWQRTGKIRKMHKDQSEIVRIPFKERTLGKGGSEIGVYEAFISMMKDLEKKAAENGEYEKAILWRDAVYKIENKSEIYDAINAIDLLRQVIPHDEIEKTLDKYTEKYKQIRGGQPEQRGA